MRLLQISAVLLSLLQFGNVCEASVVMFAQQDRAPAALIETTHGANDWLVSARIKNQGSKPIISYRVGWIHLGPGNRVRFQRGVQMNVPANIPVGSIHDVPTQNVPPDLSAQTTVFYVDEVRFADNTRWRADRKEIARQAKRIGQHENASGKNQKIALPADVDR